jgi:hypothetical protein
MFKQHNPKSVAPPFSVTATASRCRRPPAGVPAGGKVADGAGEQIEQAWRNVLSVLGAAGWGRAIWLRSRRH